MNSDRSSRAQRILEKHINELGSIYEKKEVEQKILDRKIKNLNAELEKLKNKEKELATASSTSNHKYIKSMGG